MFHGKIDEIGNLSLALGEYLFTSEMITYGHIEIYTTEIISIPSMP